MSKDSKEKENGFLFREKSNSTSSVNVTSTIVEPNMAELVSSVSTMLHCQMMRDMEADEKKKKNVTFFL